MTFNRRRLPHLQRDSKPHFVTFVTKHRWVLPDWARDLAFECCRHDHGSKYDLHAVVVMPDHVHLILTPLIDKRRKALVSLIEIMKAIKGSSAHAINRRLSLDEKVAYILENPVRRGLVTDWREYPWLWQQPPVNPYKLT